MGLFPRPVPTPLPPYALIVDDEPQVAQLVARMLSVAGYRTLVEGDGVSALRALECADGRVPIAVIDLRMPGLHGMAVAEAIATRFPATGVLLIAGNPHEAGDPASGAVLAKPFTDVELTRAVERRRQAHRRQYMRSAAYGHRLDGLIQRVARQARVVQEHVTRVHEFLRARAAAPGDGAASARGDGPVTARG